MELRVIVCWAVRRNTSVKKKFLVGSFLSFWTIIKSLLFFASTCQISPPVRACQKQRGALSLSKEAMNTAKGNVKHVSKESVSAPWPLQMLSLMLAVFVCLFAAIMLETGKRNPDNYPENLLRCPKLLGVGWGSGGKESMGQRKIGICPQVAFLSILASVNKYLT